MNNSAALAVVSELGEASLGAFTGTAALEARVSRDQLTRMLATG